MTVTVTWQCAYSGTTPSVLPANPNPGTSPVYRYMAKYIMVRVSKSGLALELALALGPVAIELIYRARQLYKNISMLFLFPVKRDLLFTNI